MTPGIKLTFVSLSVNPLYIMVTTDQLLVGHRFLMDINFCPNFFYPFLFYWRQYLFFSRGLFFGGGGVLGWYGRLMGEMVYGEARWCFFCGRTKTHLWWVDEGQFFFLFFLFVLRKSVLCRDVIFFCLFIFCFCFINEFIAALYYLSFQYF